ncbi:unnamed protein product [Mytilus coruscus]|uniref:Reverse transcriptase domain-containing protein n=1 Tax=Mytilus coruscus TaxID=42192 RepID=A0A6J8CTX0_MYTCO|nr:unnamed protein product [Mytilus coruscus]
MDFVASMFANLPIVVEDVKAITPLSDVPNVLPRQNNNPIQNPSPTPETSNNVTHLSHTWKSVVTPICSKTLKILLMGYPNQNANYLVSGFEEGFRLGYEGPREQHDFLFVGPANSNVCEESLRLFLNLCKTLGVPINTEKTEYSCTCLVFLGIELDSVLMEARLPDDNYRKIEAALQAMKVRKRVTLRELQSLIGLLNFACCVVVPGRAFLRRLIDLTKGISRPHHYIRLTKESRLDLLAWYMFINCFNGKALMLDHVWMSSVKLHLYTDASGAIGYGAIFKSHWFYGRWSNSLNECTITFKELYPIVLAVGLGSFISKFLLVIPF